MTLITVRSIKCFLTSNMSIITSTNTSTMRITTSVLRKIKLIRIKKALKRNLFKTCLRVCPGLKVGVIWWAVEVSTIECQISSNSRTSRLLQKLRKLQIRKPQQVEVWAGKVKSKSKSERSISNRMKTPSLLQILNLNPSIEFKFKSKTNAFLLMTTSQLIPCREYPWNLLLQMSVLDLFYKESIPARWLQVAR